MDDSLILAPTRWKLREAISVLNQTFNDLKLEKHQDKTIIGRIEKGFDFLRYHFSPEGLAWLQKILSGSLHVLSSFMIKNRGSLSAPAGLDWTCGGGICGL